MATNLEKLTNPNGSPKVEEPKATGGVLAKDFEITDEDIDFDALFEDETSMEVNESEDDEDVESTEELDEEDESTTEADNADDEPIVEEVEEVEPKKGKSKSLSPAEIKLINLKKENQLLLKKQKELEAKVEQKKADDEIKAITQRFVSGGYNEETAKDLAEFEIRIRKAEQLQERLDFREKNEEVFIKYPQAKADIDLIMRKAKAADMTAEQVCRALYADSIPEHEKRALNAVKGASVAQTTKPNLSGAKGIEGTKKAPIALTEREMQYKRALEKTIGDKLTDDEVRAYIKKQ